MCGDIWCGQLAGLELFVGQCPDAVVGITPEPVVHCLAGDAVTPGHICDARPVEDFIDSLRALFHNSELHEHRGPPSGLSTTTPTAKKVARATWWIPLEAKCRAGTGTTVAQVPEPRPRSVVQVPEPRCQA